MTNEQLVVLIQNAEDRSENLAALYGQNVGLLVKIALPYTGRCELEDLLQEGFLGMMTAADLWEQRAGVSFMGYAVFWIRQRIQRFYENNATLVRLPSYWHDRIRRYKREVEALRHAFGREPSSAEVAASLEVDVKEVEALKKAAQALEMVSLDSPIGEAGDAVLGDAVADPCDPIDDVIEAVQREELHEAVERVLEDLGGREAAVIRETILEDRTLKDVSGELGISTERCRQLKQKALQELRKSRYKRELEPFVERLANESISRSSLGYFKTTQTSAPEWAAIKIDQIERMRSKRHKKKAADSYPNKSEGVFF